MFRFLLENISIIQTEDLTYMFCTGASGLVHFDPNGERNIDYSLYDLQLHEGIVKFVAILNFDSHTKMIK